MGTETQEATMEARPQAEHQWLQKFVGEWTSEGKMTVAPGEEPVVFRGTESVRALGGLWVVGEAKGEMPGGGEMVSITTIGYDPRKGRYVGSFIASMMAEMWLYEGTLDEAQQTLSLDTEGPAMDGSGGRAKYRDVMKFESDDHRVLTSHVLGEDGEYRQFMEAHYRRK
jgi:hypothetical protein